MAAVRMFISKFGREVLIDADHPLAVAERAKVGGEASESGTRKPAAIEPTAAEAPAPAPPTESGAFDALSFAELRAEAKARGINTYQMGADEIRAALGA